MEIDKLIKVKNISKKFKHLHYIAFIKFIAMITIIKWHICSWKEKPIDYGARMCELLFITSGFLVGYNYFRNPIEANYKNSFTYAYKHFKSFYPFYLINTLIDMHIHRRISIDLLTRIEILIINIFICQSWSRYKEFVPCFNGHTWFLSVLLFCYFLSPLLMIGIKNIKRSIILLLIISLIRIFGELLMINGAINLFDADFHYGPIIRLLEYYMGMLSVPLYFSITFYIEKYPNKMYIKICFSFLQIFLPILLYITMLKFNYILYRCYFTLIFSLFVILFGLDYGIFSNIFSYKIFQLIMNCQIEMYLLQLNINYYFNILISNNVPTNRIYIESIFVIKLIIIYIIALLYKNLLKTKLSYILDKIIFSIIGRL